MPTFKLDIKTENAAFEDDQCGVEIARILREIADKFDRGEPSAGTVRDVNGNRVGKYRYD